MRAAAAAGIAVAAWLAGTAGALAQADTVDRRLESVERALEEGLSRERQLEGEAAALEREIVALRAELVTAARTVQNVEERLNAFEKRLAGLERAEARKTAALEKRRAALTATLGALERLGRQPPEVVIASRATLGDAIRTSLLLAAAVPALEGEARRLREELDALAALRREITAERAGIAAASSRLSAERRRLDALLARKSAASRMTLEKRRVAERRVARLAAEASDLRELMERLSVAAPPPGAKPPDEKPPGAKPPAEEPSAGKPPATIAPAPGDTAGVPLVAGVARAAPRSFTAARGTLPLPVRGRVVGLFGRPGENGARAKGITIETRPGARVITPYDGRVVFAGPFRRYGQLLIIENGEGYHTLLAGLTRIDSGLGQWLLAGEPVGVMGPGSNGNPTLYVELRRRGEAISPLPWLAAGERKVGG